MISTSNLFISNTFIVKADSTPPENEDYNVLNSTYIKNIVDNLSKIISNPNIFWKYDIPKGRAFGTAGERYAAENIIEEEMKEIGLWNVTMDNISNIKGVNLSQKLEITSLGLSINHSGTITDISEFFISPRWNYTELFQMDFSKKEKDTLSHNFSYEDQELLVVRKPKFPCFKYIINKIFEKLIDGLNDYKIAINVTLNDYTSLLKFIMNKFEEEYNFTWDNSTGIGPDHHTLPWYNATIASIDQPFVLICEDPTFNPEKIKPEIIEDLSKIHPLNLLSLFYERFQFYIQTLVLHNWSEKNNDYFKGLILFDHNNDTYNMANWKTAVPLIYINRTIGKDIYDDTSIPSYTSDEYTINFHINQSFNESVVSYNVIGQINGTNPDETLILSSYYDSFWNAGVVDGAIPMSTVLAIAKYMRELNETYGIEPKRNVKFIGFGGEEYGYIGAHYYVKKYEKKNITHVIDLNQLGFIQNDPPYPLDLYIGVDKFLLCPLIKTIVDNSQYEKRLDDGTESKVRFMPYGIPANANPFATHPTQTILNFPLPTFIKKPFTIGFLKDTNWTRHHRDGLDHEEGDTMKYWYGEDVNLSGEMIWNVTKFFSINPDCDFNGTPSYFYWDSDDQNSDYDTINVSFNLTTIMPKEKVSVRLVLFPKTISPPTWPILYRHRVCEEFYVTTDGVSGYINTTLPDNFPKCEYVAWLYLCNSSGDAIIGSIDNFNLKLSGLELIYFIREGLGYDILNGKFVKFFEGLRSLIHLNVVDFIQNMQDIRIHRNLIKDILGYGIFSDNSSKSTANMAPPNDPPNPPDTPEDLEKVFLKNWYRTKTTDPDSDDKIRYQWNWSGTKGFWSVFKYKQGKYHYKDHLWLSKGEKTIKVRAKNPWSPNVFSNWSEALTVDIGPSCSFNVASSQSSQNNMNNPYVVNSFDSSIVVAGEEYTYQGGSCDVGESPSYGYYFEDTSGIKSDQTQHHTFNTIGEKYVNLTVSEGETTVYYNTTMTVQNVSPCYNMNQLGAQPNQDITFNDSSISKYLINNWTWDFDDGHFNYTQNTSYNFSQVGAYNVSLTVRDTNGESFVFWQIVHVETNLTDFITAEFNPLFGTLGCNVTLFAEFWDHNESGISNAYVNISYPNGTTNNFSMVFNENSTEGYEYVFNDTMQVGWYYFTIWVTDNCGNINDFAGCGFEILHAFGNSVIGNFSKNIKDNISGSNFTCFVNGTAESISAYIQTNQTPNAKTKCIIYRENDSKLIGTTEEKIISTGDEPDWITYNFTGTKPSLTTNAKYILSFWSNDTCYLYYDNVTDDRIGRYNSTIYGSSPSSISWDDNDSNLYSIYCTYSTVPEIISVTNSPDPIGFGYNTTISAEIEHYYTLVDNITVNISYPDYTFVNNSMSKVDDDTFQYTFDDAWLVGKYNYSIWVKDKLEGNSSDSGYSFNVSANGTISVCTIKDSYDNNETVNLTDPPGGSSQIGYELLDDGKVLHIWNRYDSYYFNTSSGIQLTNHYNDYWSHNVLMLGYYNNDQWNLIYRTDELSGFNKDIDSDNSSYVNVTIWKDLTYQGYDFRLAIRYNLGVDDNDLTVIPYIKNIDQDDIPYVLGFGWEMKDIQINMTTSGDYIDVNRTMYYLNQTLDNVYSDLPEAEFYLMENITDSKIKSLYLKWNQSLNYKLQVKSRPGQYNAPITLFIKIGTLDAGQEKYTSLFWYDADQVIYYFDSYDDSPMGEAWVAYPGYLVDGSISNSASTTSNGDVELCTGNNCSGTDLGTILNVALRVKSYYSGGQRDTILRPVFGGTNDGADHNYQTSVVDTWSQWFDITNDPYAPQSWTWSDVESLDCDVVAENAPLGPPFTLYCSKIEIRVGYVPYNHEPDIGSPVPVDGASGIGIQPVLNITVNDQDGDDMNITWLSNSSGSWISFGTNSSVQTGTYHQTFSNATENGQWWYWKVNVSDGVDYKESSVYKFYTGNQSKIKNTGSTNIKGYLLIQVQYYNTTSSSWVFADDTINETTPRTITSGGQFGLDTVFNGNVNTTYLINNFGSGTYRVYASFRDTDGDVLVCDDESLLESNYQFTISTS
ncbi:hypothetical protein AYK21_03435 [Thermoplasmatales archaeon SG8-52-2]|nr:MAG: hypothetical protein AYK21_03435 [Thermoplasmatales archaeon SG8-52-2]